MFQQGCETESFYLFVSSADSKDIYVDNCFGDFTVELPKLIDLPPSWDGCYEWNVALIDVTTNTANGNVASSLLPTVLVLCDVVKESHLMGKQIPLLRILPGESVTTASVSIPQYMKLHQHTFNRLRIRLVNTNLEPIGKDSNRILACTLHFQRIVL